MNGSEKQIAWAKKIKSAILAVVEADFNEITTTIGIYISATKTEADEIQLARLQKNSAILADWIATAKQNEDSEYWIDNKDLNTRTIIKKHNKEARN